MNIKIAVNDDGVHVKVENNDNRSLRKGLDALGTAWGHMILRTEENTDLNRTKTIGLGMGIISRNAIKVLEYEAETDRPDLSVVDGGDE